MSFFEANNIDDQRFTTGGQHEEEDVAVYTWGEDGYDDLGDALEERGDDLNDETFGDSGAIGRDFDFGHSVAESVPPQQGSVEKPRAPVGSLESIWDDKSPSSVLPRMVNAGRQVEQDSYRKHGPRLDPLLSVRTEERLRNPPTSATFPSYDLSPSVHQPARTLQEIEAELRASAQMAREQQQVQSFQINEHAHPQLLHHPNPIQLQQVDFRNQMHMYQQHQFMMSNMAQLPPALQQQLMAQASEMNVLPDHMYALDPQQRDTVLNEAMRKIMEAEQMEARRRRKAAKIARMSKYNDLMTQSDKDFITRIQVSQLVTQDPYADDFYAQVYGAILRSRMGTSPVDGGVLKFGTSGGVGLGVPGSRGAGRRENAMQRMQAQVERIVNNAKNREIAKGTHPLSNLQGALGKTSGRSYKAAPRQLLQVETTPTTSPVLNHAQPIKAKNGLSMPASDGASKESTKLALGLQQGNGISRAEPLSHREVLVILEGLYDVVLRVEQLRRVQPSAEDVEGTASWTAEYASLVDQLWSGLRVMDPLETSEPHPFISLITPVKGKRLLPRLTRHLLPDQMLTLLTLLVACFGQLDVVQDSAILDHVAESKERKEVERQTVAFLASVLPPIIPVVAKSSLRLVSGLLGLLLDRCDVVTIARTRPGLALLTLFLSRVEVVKQRTAESDESPSPEDIQQWQSTYDRLFQLLADHLLSLFPSTRAVVPYGTTYSSASDVVRDQPVWQFLAALALHAAIEQQQLLVTSLREKVLENVMSAAKGWVVDETEREAKIGNVNLFLHALGLDSSQITV